MNKLYKITAIRMDHYYNTQVYPDLCIYRRAQNEKGVMKSVNYHGFKMKESYRNIKIEEVVE